jgi:hypothetical protein
VTSNSQMLRVAIALGSPALTAASARLWRPAGLRGRYPEYLRVMHSVIRATAPLLSAARDRSAELGERRLARYFDEHLDEETGHDEWLRQDLAALGEDPDEPLRRPPGANVAALVGAQYYWLHHYHPVCLLGYIAVLEGNPPTTELIDHLERATGYPPECFETMRSHAVLDIGHRRDLDMLLDGLTLSQDHRLALGRSALHTIERAVDVFSGLAAWPHAGIHRFHAVRKPRHNRRIG